MLYKSEDLESIDLLKEASNSGAYCCFMNKCSEAFKDPKN